jgi:O-antigen/teichoic acid export membrane protein
MSLSPLPAIDSTISPSATSVEVPAATIAYGREGLGIWGVRSAHSFLDQGLTSGSGLAVNLLLARWLLADAYGAFAVAYAGFLFVSGFHNVLVVEPLSVWGSSRHAKKLQEYFCTQIAVHAILVGTLSAVLVTIGLAVSRILPESSAAGAALGVGLALPLLLLLWLARRMCYVAQRSSMAVLGSGVCAVLVFVGLFALERFGELSPFTAFVLMGASSGLAAGLLLWKLGLVQGRWLRVSRRSCASVIQENWRYGNWLTLTTVLSWFSVQAQVFLAANLLGLTSAGILRALQLPALVMSQVVAASIQIMLPRLSRELGRGDFRRMHRTAVATSAFLTSVGTLLVISLLIFSSQTEQLFYGGKYKAHAWLLPVLGLAPVFTGFSSIFSCALRALGKSRFELLAYVLSSLTALATSVVLMPRWGLQGAAVSVVSSAAVLAAAVYISYLLWGTPQVVPPVLRAGAIEREL